MLVADSQLISRLGPGTPMWKFVREFWPPASHSSDLVVGEAPMRLRAYPTRDRNGVLLVFMGVQDKVPPLHETEATRPPQQNVPLLQAHRRFDWLQALEGRIDSSHLGFLHLRSVGDEDVSPENLHGFAVYNRVTSGENVHFCLDPRGKGVAPWIR